MISYINNLSGFSVQIDTQSVQQFKSKMFNKIDRDGSGGIDKTEFSDIAKQLSEMSGKSVNVDSIFSTYDKNSDGSLNLEELDSFNKDNPPPLTADMNNAMSAYAASSPSWTGDLFPLLTESNSEKKENCNISSLVNVQA